MKKNNFLFLFSLFLLGIACNSSKKTTVVTVPNDETTTTETVESTIAWNFIPNAQMNLSDVLAKAKAEKKLVFIDAYATWCSPCKLMDRNVFTHSPTADFFNKNFISYKVNVDKDNGSTIKLLYDVNTLPGLLFLNANGDLLVKEQNSITISQLKSLANKAIAKAK
jgi:thiol:disulfide interchange protein